MPPSAPALIRGLAGLHRAIMNGVSLPELIQQATCDEPGAADFMTLAMIFLMTDNLDAAAQLQSTAIQLNPWYRIQQDTIDHPLRLLVIMQPGFMLDNTPIDFILHDPRIRMDWLYIDQQLPDQLPEHDVLFIAIGESMRARPLLTRLAQQLQGWPQPVINRPARIPPLSRHELPGLLSGIEGIVVPATQLVERVALESGWPNATFCSQANPTAASSWILRPTDTHGGHGLQRIESPDDLTRALNDSTAGHFHVAPFIDYRSADGLYRKCRLALCNGQAFVGHLAISDHWMVHYKNANMLDHPERRQEEQHFMQLFSTGFASRHAHALRKIAERTELDYVVIDCAELPDGRLLIFEMDNRGFMHAIDPPEWYAWKPQVMQPLFDAFTNMLLHHAQ